MLNTFRGLLRRLGGPEEKRHFGDDDVRLALAALLVHAMAIDGIISPDERKKLEELLRRKYLLAAADLSTLVDDAIEAEREAVDLYRFTSVLKRQMDEEERIRVVESLWEIVYADGSSHEFEENLVWRVAELMAVNPRDRIAKKRAVAERRSAEAAENG